MKYTLKKFGNSNAYMMEVVTEGYAGQVQLLRTKPTKRQVRSFISTYKWLNKMRGRIKDGHKVLWR